MERFKLAARIVLAGLVGYGMIVLWPILNSVPGHETVLYGFDAIAALFGFLGWFFTLLILPVLLISPIFIFIVWIFKDK